jgi:hypothetical protein
MVWDGKQHNTGNIEAKTPVSNLDHIENSGKLKRYRDTFPQTAPCTRISMTSALNREWGKMAMKTYIAAPPPSSPERLQSHTPA